MNEKQICLFCGEEITDSDEAVECLYCEGLYHRECRENIPGCVVPGCFGGNVPAESDFDESFIRPENPIQPETDLAELCERNKDYYGRVFAKFRRGKALSWNWAACYFSCAWFVYRKMYFEAAIIALITVLVRAVCVFIPEIAVFLAVVYSLAYILVPLFANYIYYKKISADYSEYEALARDEKEEFIKKRCGTYPVVAVVVGVISIIVNIIFNMASVASTYL